MKQLSGLDTLFLRTEMHGLPMHISILSIYDSSTAPAGRVEFRNIIELFENEVQGNLSILRQKIFEVPFGIDQPYWVEDQSFDLVYHLRHIALPKPGNWQKLCSLVANLHAQPLNRNRPLWEAYVIDGLDHLDGIPEGAFAILLKVHHALMDGRTGMAVFNSLHTKLNASNIEENIDEHFFTHEPDLSMPRILANAAVNNLHKSGSLLRIAGRAVGLYGAIMRGLESREIKQLHKNRTRFNGVISPRRVVDRISIPLDKINRIRECAEEATVSDIALTVIGGAMRRYLLAKDEMPEDTLVAAVPLSIKSSGDDASFLGNHKISIANVALRTDVKGAVDRLQRVHKESLAGKNYAKALGNNLIAETVNSLYSGLVSWGIRTAIESGVLEKFPPANNTVVANVAGSSEKLMLCGATLVDSFGMGPLIPNTGLFHAVSSTWRTLTIAFTADRQKLEDPGFYAQCLQSSFDELYQELCLKNDSQPMLTPTDGEKQSINTSVQISDTQKTGVAKKVAIKRSRGKSTKVKT